MNKRNYQKELEKTLLKIKEGAEGDGARPSLFLHSCCAPCSSYVLEYLSQYFSITVFYYNPNISPEEEYEERVSEQQRLIRELNEEWSGDQSRTPVRFLSGPYEPERFYQAVKGLENYVVIDTGRALLICPKDDRKLKEFTARLSMPGFENYR